MKTIRSYAKKLLIQLWVSNKKIDYIYFDLYQNKVELIKNYLYYKLGKINEIEYTLKRKVLIHKERFWDNNFYQSYPPLNFKWERDTLERFQTYELENYIDTQKEILDIWWNLCFFSLYTSRFVKHIDIIEYNSNLAEIWSILKEYENIKNVEIFNMDFKKFSTEKKYDIIFSFAIHMWVWLPFREYLERIHWLLKKDWILLLESQDLNSDPFEENLEQIKDLFDLIKIKDSNDHQNNIRKIAILKKQ